MVQSAALIRQHMTFGYFDAGGVRGTIRVQSGKKKSDYDKRIKRMWSGHESAINQMSVLLFFPSIEGLICTSWTGVCH